MRDLHSQWRVPVVIEVRGEMIVTAKDIESAKKLVERQAAPDVLRIYMVRTSFKKVIGTPKKSD